MRSLSKILIALAVVGGIAIVGIGVGWFASRGPADAPAPPPASASVSAAPTASVSPSPPVIETATTSTPPTPVAVENTPADTAQPAVTNTADAGEASTNWADRVDNIIASDDADTNKVKQLLALFPDLPPDGQVEVAQHLSNLTPDEDYAALGKLLEDDKLSSDVLDVLLGDTLNRPNSLKLPELLTVAQDPNNPKAGEAKDLLELFLGEDYGPVADNADTWKQKTTAWLKDNPD